MSLINDALKRAQDQQSAVTPTPTAPGPELRPAEPVQTTLRGAGLILPGALALVALLVLFMAWQVVQRRSDDQTPLNTSPLTARARTAEPLAPVPMPAAVPAPTPPAPPALQTAVGTPAPAAPTEATPSPSSAAAGAPESSTNSTVATAPQPPRPPPLKLQGIVLNPSRPSAMINGRTLFVGDHIREFLVVKIGADTVTLKSASQQKVLVLGESSSSNF